jgi:Tol biopolymer transport system component
VTRRARLPLLVFVLSALVGLVAAVASGHSDGGSPPSQDGLLAFVRNTVDPADPSGDPDSALWVVRPDGTGLRRLTRPCQDCDGEPAWSPDGSKLAYVVGGSVYVIRVDGTGDHLLCQSACLHSPTWPTSPLRYANGPDCFCMDRPVWAPDGKQIAFLTTGPGGNRMAIGIVSVDGKHLRVLRTPHLGYCSFATGLDWSPDGAQLMVSAAVGDPFNGGLCAQVFVMGADGRGLRRLRLTAVSPRWSPDGASVLYTGYSGNALYVTSLRDGRSTRTLSSAADSAAWSSDGREIAATTPKGIQTFDLPTGRSRVVPIKLRGTAYGDVAWQHVPLH